MEVILVACLATLALVAVLSRATASVAPRPLRHDSKNGLDQALFHLINEVARKPTPKRREHVEVDRVSLGDRLRRQHKTWV